MLVHTATSGARMSHATTWAKNPVGKKKLERMVGGGAVVEKLEHAIQPITSH